MEIVEQVKEHNVTDYDFMFASGSKLAITVDYTAGDVFDVRDDCYVVHIAPRPSPMDPEKFTDPEKMTIYKRHLAFVAQCDRKQAQPSKEDIFKMHEAIKGVAKQVQ